MPLFYFMFDPLTFWKGNWKQFPKIAWVTCSVLLFSPVLQRCLLPNEHFLKQTPFIPRDSISASAVTDSKKYSIIIYRKSTTSFPTS